MGRKSSSKRTRNYGLLLLTAAIAVAALSIAVRWTGISANLERSQEKFQIEILNGTKEPRAAMEVAKALRKQGVDVLIVDNAERDDFQTSVLVDRIGNKRLARRIARIVGCKEVIEQVRDKPLVDATLVIGADRMKRR